jgi:hypothetical protein
MMTDMIDLTPFVAKGFPGKIDEFLPKVAVGGIDKAQTLSQVRLCPETEAELYGPSFSATRIRYVPGSRPVLESIVKDLEGKTPRERAESASRWVAENVSHPYLVGKTRTDRGFTEEQLIESGIGWCNEQARVFIALCQVMEIPARVVFIYHKNTLCGHTTAEAYINGKWSFFDPTFAVDVPLPDGSLASAAEISGSCRYFAHQAYRKPLEDAFSRFVPFAEEGPGWNKTDRVKAEAGGDLLETIGICNYIIDGVEVVD